MDEALAVHRLHFAFTITFHYLFPQLTMGLALLLVILKSAALAHRDDRYNVAARFWAKIFAINFALGVVTGVALKTHDPVAGRARAVARRAWIGAAALTAAVTWFTMRLQPQVPANLSRYPLGFAFPGLALCVYRKFAGRVSPEREGERY